jgi:UDP-glucose 4-epimerase
MYKEKYGIDYVALRYTAVYGERQHGRAVMGGHIAESCMRIRNGEKPIIPGDGTQVQDYIYVGDLARGNLMAMESEVSGEAFNLVTGRDTSQKRIVELALEAAGSDLEPEYVPFKVLRLPPATRQCVSNAKAKRMLGWEPQVTIEEGVRRVLRWVDEKRAQAN